MLDREAVRFLISEWADGCTVYDRRYGDTHALNHLTAAVFRLALAAPGSCRATIAAQLAEEFSALNSPEWISTIDLALEQLVNSRLIQGQS
ncbi:HPr-rel-A system PqqD family peptide chaperone [Paucibacter sp. B2R-40]|uniref:HPr-rel-A system PqqD family peptide chaperone n=1 Tax=Paucibacter sp. B2R-40 TaxID=2893554 RepID=UPI0021E400C1|nr:HPr-rel-A system PqqD family peptide chaperone [Paucibacter sp. B2R-40]MCV2353138.1 HPr-rel-A system PqqD family peptide chaperone [Paucibacter sp. B2R-40]